MTTNTQELQVPQKEQEPSILELLRDIRAVQDLQGRKLDEISHRVTGGLDVTKGLEFRTSQLEVHREEQRRKDEKREAVTSGLIVTVGAALILATLALIFKTGTPGIGS